jgi:transcriptional regulator with XRE-family HTH domain
MATNRVADSRDGDGRQRFGALLANALKARAMKQEQLAGMLGTTQSSVSGWINGKYEPSAATVFTIEQSLGMDPGYLSRPLGYLPLEAAAAPLGVDGVIAQSPLLDDEDKVVLTSLYELLAGKRARSAVAPALTKKPPATRGRSTATPGATRPQAAPVRPRTLA